MSEQSTRRHLAHGFVASCERHPDSVALEVDGKSLTYSQLRELAGRIASTLLSHLPSHDPPLTAVLASRSVTAFAGVLGALFRGHGYVPLNPRFPSERNRRILTSVGCRAIIVDSSAEAQLDSLAQSAEHALLLLLPENGDVRALRNRWPRHTILGAEDLEPFSALRPMSATPDSIAYLLFTSGTTGVPKGVMVTHRNVTHFVDQMVARYHISELDRFSQTFELVFDLSVFDMFVAWERGACVCCPSHKQMMTPSSYIRDAKLTMWFSVPSVARMMEKLRMLDQGRYPHLRFSLFCGEALSLPIASAWSKAAPNSMVENLYGPTELTVACTGYRWNPQNSPTESERGMLPIGQPFSGMSVLVTDEHLREVPTGEVGELLVAGPQVTAGYWKDPERTVEAFVRPPGQTEVFYRTGDRVRRPRNADEPLRCLGRSDRQLKIRGSRVELGEVEEVLRDAAGVDTVVALGWPTDGSDVDGIVAFIGAEQADLDAIREQAKAQLPPYMVPREMRLMPEIPLTANGKVDVSALIRSLEELEKSEC